MAGITDIFWRKLEYYKTTRTTKEQCFSYFAGQSDKIVLNREYESIVTNGLVLNLDAGFLPSYPATGSSWQDLSEQGNNGTLQNGPTFDSGGWINFDGSNDFVQLSNTITLTSEFTLNLFILPTSTSTRVLLGNDGSDYLQINNSTALGLFSSTESITLDGYSWDTSVTSMVTVTRNTSNNIQTYINSVSSVSGTLTGNFRIKQIGQRGDLSRFYMGNIYKTQVYNRSLTQQEILQNYYKGSIVTDGLNIYYDAGNLVSYDRVGVTWSNLSGTGSSGILNNGATFSEIRGGSIIFDGVNDNFAATNTILQISSAFSIEYAVSILTVPTSSYKYIFRHGQGYQSNGVYAEFGPGYLSLCTVNSTASAASVYLFSPGSNTLYYVSVTYENRSLKGYVNGVLVQTNNISFDPLNSSQTTLNIGQNGEFTIPLWRFYTRALSLSEVKQNFHANRTRLGL